MRGAHIAPAILDEEIAALAKLDTHLVGKKGMFVIGGIVDAGGEHRQRRLVGGGRRDRGQRLLKHVRVVFDWRDPVLGEQLRKQEHHRLAALQHVGDAGRRAAIVLQHEIVALADPHDVDADDMRIDVARRVDADHLRHEGLVLQDELCRNALGPQNLLPVIDIMDEGIESAHPLLDAGSQAPPFRRCKQPGDDVEGNQPLIGLDPAIDREGDAAPAEDRLGFLLVAHQIGARQAVQPGGDLGVMAPDVAVRQRHLVNNALRHGISRWLSRGPSSMVTNRTRSINPFPTCERDADNRKNE